MERCEAVGLGCTAFVVVTHGVAVGVTQFLSKNHQRNRIFS